MDNKELIQMQALHLFANRGYQAVGVQEIVDRAAVTKPTLYHYFGSKLGLLNALLEGYFKLLFSLLKQPLDYRGDLPQTLFEVTGCIFQFARENPAFYRLQLALWFSPKGSEEHLAVIEWQEKLSHMFENLFIQAAIDHGNMRNRHIAFAATFLGLINTYIGLSLNGYIDLSEDLARAAVKQFQHGIYS